MADPFQAYERELASRDLAPSTVVRYLELLKRYESFVSGRVPCAQAAKEFIADIRVSGYADRSIEFFATVVRGFQSFLGDPFTYKHRKRKKLPPYFPWEDVGRLLDQMNVPLERQAEKVRRRDRALITILAYTGMRRSEVTNLLVGDVNLNSGHLLVRNGKGGKDRVIPLHDVIQELLAALCAERPRSARVFAELSDRRVHAIVTRHAKRCGLSGWHPHSLRHAFATKLAEEGANILHIQELLGHADLETTAIYLAFRPNQLRDAVDLLPGQRDLDGSRSGAGSRTHKD